MAPKAISSAVYRQQKDNPGVTEFVEIRPGAGQLLPLPLPISALRAAKWSATWPMVLLANTSGCALASSAVSGSSGHTGC